MIPGQGRRVGRQRPRRRRFLRCGRCDGGWNLCGCPDGQRQRCPTRPPSARSPSGSPATPTRSPPRKHCRSTASWPRRPELRNVSDAVRKFAEMLHERRGRELPDWIDRFAAEGCPPLRRMRRAQGFGRGRYVLWTHEPSGRQSPTAHPKAVNAARRDMPAASCACRASNVPRRVGRSARFGTGTAQPFEAVRGSRAGTVCPRTGEVIRAGAVIEGTR